MDGKTVDGDSHPRHGRRWTGRVPISQIVSGAAGRIAEALLSEGRVAALQSTAHPQYWPTAPLSPIIVSMLGRFPYRIVCLSADWLARIGAWEQVAGVTAFFEQPQGLPARPRISGFSTARLDPIVSLNPDLVVGFSDVQAVLAAELIRRAPCA